MSEHEKSKDGKADASAKENQAQNPSGITNGTKSDMPPTPCDNGGKKKHKKPIHEWIKYFVEIFGILGGLIGLVILILQYFESAKTTKVLSGQLHEMQAARILDERAWVLPFLVQTFVLDKSGTVEFHIKYKNTGKTPAMNVDCITKFAKDKKLIPQKDEIPNPPKSSALLAPDGEGFATWRPLPNKFIQEAHNGVPLYIYGTVWYDDIFGIHHWSQFCFLLDSTGNFCVEDIHNSCDDVETSQTN